MNLAFLIPDGVGARNFLLGALLRTASREGPCSVLHAIPQDYLDIYRAGLNDTVQWEELQSSRDSALSFVLRDALSYAHQYWCDTHAMRFARQKAITGSRRRKAARRVAKVIGRAAASPPGIRLLNRWQCRATDKLPAVEHYRRYFQRTRPSALFCSHQRPPSVQPPVLAARSLGIPTATFIFSWDNLTTKSRIAAPFDHYLVWSDQMRQELLQYYPDVSEERVHIVGTPQFDFYADQSLLWTREEFFRRINADPGRPLICYSGGDTSIYSREAQFVRILMDFIRQGRITGKPQVLLRPSPVDEGGRYTELRRQYPELIYAPPAWIHSDPGNWASVLPVAEDIQFLANLTSHSDLNINLASTMTLDFAIRGKPVVNVAFDVDDPPPLGVSLWNHYYRFDHYRPVLTLGAARIAHSPDQLVEHVSAYLQEPTLDREQRQQFVDLEVGIPLGQSTTRILDVLRSIARDA